MSSLLFFISKAAIGKSNSEITLVSLDTDSSLSLLASCIACASSSTSSKPVGSTIIISFLLLSLTFLERSTIGFENL